MSPLKVATAVAALLLSFAAPGAAESEDEARGLFQPMCVACWPTIAK